MILDRGSPQKGEYKKNICYVSHISLTELITPVLYKCYSQLQATFEGWMELMDDAVDSKEVIVDFKCSIFQWTNLIPQCCMYSVFCILFVPTAEE